MARVPIEPPSQAQKLKELYEFVGLRPTPESLERQRMAEMLKNGTFAPAPLKPTTNQTRRESR